MIVYLHEVLGNMTRELLGCTFYKIIEAGSSNSLNKTEFQGSFVSCLVNP